MGQKACFIERIVDADLCTGCGVCAALVPGKLALNLAEDGFLRPRTSRPLSRNETRQVAAACPGGTQMIAKGAVPGHSLWGQHLDVAQGWATDNELRHAGASGGGLSATLVWLLETGQVDGVLQIAADPRDPVGNRTVVSRTRAEVLQAAASRYAPSAPLLTVPDLLKSGEKFAFVGKPCDVSALRNWAKLDPKVNQTFPVMLSFFCAGVPSRHGGAEVVEALGVEASDLARFRYRGNGWPGVAEAIAHDGDRRSMSYSESWGTILSRHVQPRCRICADGIGLEADLVFADAWESDAKGYPVFDEGDGISLIMARTKVGKALFERAVEAGQLTCESFDIAELETIQPGQTRRRRELIARLVGRLISGTAIPRYRGVEAWRAAKGLPFRQSLRVALGMARRCVIRRRQKL